MLTEGVHRREMPLEQFAKLLSENPAKIVGLWPQKGAIQVGADADLMLVDPDREWTIDRTWLKSQHPHSPFIGWKIKGWIRYVLSRGRPVAVDGEVIAEGGGRWLRPV
ncbi:MAG: amidohydrolase family protein, partial [bacterium]